MEPFGIRVKKLGQIRIDEVLQMESCAGPFVLGWALAEAASHRIGRDVIDRSGDCFGRIQVPIKSCSFLPEPEALLTGPFLNHQLLNKW